MNIYELAFWNFLKIAALMIFFGAMAGLTAALLRQAYKIWRDDD